MKFSRIKKLKMRKQRQQRVARTFNRGYFCLGYSVEEEERKKRYTIISKMVKNGDYYLLLANENSNEVCIGKAVYSGHVKVIILSSKKVLEDKVTFKNWLKDINREMNKYGNMVKYVLTEDGVIECRNTDYRGNYKLPRIVHNWDPVYKYFQY